MSKQKTPSQVRKRNKRNPPKPKMITTKAKPKSPNSTAKFIASMGGRGKYPAISPSLATDSVTQVRGLTSVVEKKMTISNASLDSFAYGYVDYLTSRGFGSSADTQAIPYFLACEIKLFMIAALTKQVPRLNEGPQHLNILYNLLKPKIIGVKTGQVSYSWETSSVSNALPPVSGFNPVYNMGLSIPKQTGTYAFSAIGSTSSYTPEGGTEAWAAYVSYLKLDSQPIVTLNTSLTPFDTDASAFSATYPDIGQSTSGLGGSSCSNYNAAIIKTPLSAVWTPWDSDTLAYLTLTAFASSPRYFATTLLHTQRPIQLHNKAKPLFLPIDINDLFDLLSIMIGTAIEKAMLDATYTVIPTCQLSGPEVFLLLRAVVSTIQGSHFASDVIPYGSDFVPLQFHSAQQNVMESISTMLLPTVFVENLHGLSATTLQLGSVKNKKRTNNGSQYLQFAPVFGTYDVNRSLATYSFTLKDGSPLYMTTPANAPDTLNQATLLAVSSTDQSYINPIGTELTSAIKIWNAWVGQLNKYIKIEAYSPCRPGALSYACMFANVVYTVMNEPPQRNNEPKKSVRSSSRREAPELMVTSYAERARMVGISPTVSTYTENVVALLSNNSYTPENYKLIRNWVLPKFVINSNDTLLSIATIRTSFVMPYALFSSKTTNPIFENRYVSLQDGFIALADEITSATTNLDSIEYYKMIDVLRTKGAGGFWSSLVGGAVASITGIPEIATLANKIPI